MSYPKTMTISKLKDISTKYLADEVVKRYNSHEVLCAEVERLEDEVGYQIFYKRVYAVVGILSMLIIIGLIFTSHE